MDTLPFDVVLSTAKPVVSDSANAMEDLSNLRRTSKEMRKVCENKALEAAIPLERVIGRADFDDYTYVSLITNLANAGNMEACFRRGLYDAFVAHCYTLHPPLGMLEQCSDAGHPLASFLLSLLLYRSNAGAERDGKACELLRTLEGDEDKTGSWEHHINNITKSRIDAFPFVSDVISRFQPDQLLANPHRQDQVMICCNSWPHTFCREECRMHNEFVVFFTRISKIKYTYPYY